MEILSSSSPLLLLLVLEFCLPSFLLLLRPLPLDALLLIGVHRLSRLLSISFRNLLPLLSRPKTRGLVGPTLSREILLLLLLLRLLSSLLLVEANHALGEDLLSVQFFRLLPLFLLPLPPLLLPLLSSCVSRLP